MSGQCWAVRVCAPGLSSQAKQRLFDEVSHAVLDSIEPGLKEQYGFTGDLQVTGMPCGCGAKGGTAMLESLMRIGEVADLFGVAPRTVVRWECQGKLAARRTPGGHRRYLVSEVEELYRRTDVGRGEVQ